MRKAYVVALDQGTTSSRAMLVDANGCVVDAVQNPFPQVYPQPGWVEHDPRDILSSQLGALTELLVAHNLGAKDIDSIPPTWTASASRTSARPRSCGTARRAGPWATPSCGSAAARPPSSTS